jgi:hypothetical protein
LAELLWFVWESLWIQIFGSSDCLGCGLDFGLERYGIVARSPQWQQGLVCSFDACKHAWDFGDLVSLQIWQEKFRATNSVMVLVTNQNANECAF